MDIWFLYDAGDDDRRPYGAFLTPHGAMDWAVREAGDGPSTTWAWTQDAPDRVTIRGDHEPDGITHFAGWATIYVLERGTLFDAGVRIPEVLDEHDTVV